MSLNFDLSNGFVLLRLLIALFLIPHIFGKVKHRGPVTGFFDAVGFRPAPVFVMVAMVFEIVVAAALILGAFTQIAAAIRLRKVIRNEWFLALSGVVVLVLGFLLIVQPAEGAIALVIAIATFALAWGIVLIVLGFRLRALSRMPSAARPA